MWKRLLLLIFCLGCVVSAAASGRFTPRLIADGMLSFVFVAVCEMAGFALSRRLLVTRGTFGADAERFLRGNWPWLVWALSLAAYASLTRPDAGFNVFNLLMLAAALPIIASISIDYRLFREHHRAGRGRAIAAVLAQRAVAWPLCAVYFLGFAVPPRELAATFAELGQMMTSSIRLMLS